MKHYIRAWIRFLMCAGFEVVTNRCHRDCQDDNDNGSAQFFLLNLAKVFIRVLLKLLLWASTDSVHVREGFEERRYIQRG